MKNILIAILTIALLLAPALGFAEASPASAGTLTVQGKATIMVEPDKADLSFGVEITKDEAKAAQEKVNSIINAAVDAIKAAGIDEKSIRTDSISISRQYDYSGDTPVAKGFTASTQLTVSLDDIKLSGAIIDAALKAGVNNVNDIAFSSSKQSDYYDQALAVAMENARHKADILAKAAGSSIVSVNSISENYYDSPYVVRSNAQYSGAKMSDSAESTSISVGEIEISASVTATYKIN